jgi:hypothetical protein
MRPTWREVEEAVRGRADPLAQIFGIGQRGRQRQDADWRLQLAADVAHAAGHNLPEEIQKTVLKR